jgi:succinoglycan biosynthesis protein ExoM
MIRLARICVCVCTYKRPELLGQLLSKLESQQTGGILEFSIVIVDNDRSESGRAVAEAFALRSSLKVSYHLEPEQNIARARNRAVAHADGEFLAFIDDDELPIDDWLLRLHATLVKYAADGVLGPVPPQFTVPPPQWVIKGRILERPRYETGFAIDWRETGTGNVLMRRRILDEVAGPFNPELYRGGEDTDFFRRAMEAGRRFVWCDEAVAYEVIPVERTRLSFQLRRALLRGKVSLSSPSGRAPGILKSLAASAVYTLLLPLFLVRGRHVFIAYLIKDFDHIGKLLAVVGFDVIREKYVLK